ncbi:MAG: Fe-S cluster assembly protein SufD [Acidobacteriota bacterium]
MAEATLDVRGLGLTRLLETTGESSRDLPEMVLRLRREGRESFERLGVPSRRDEEWRYTDLSPLLALDLVPAPAADLAAAEGFLKRSAFGRLAETSLVFVNGRYVPELSKGLSDPSGPVILPLREAWNREPAVVERFLGRVAGFRESAFASFNLAFLENGAYIRIPAGRVVEQPLQIVYLTLGAEAGLISPRVLVVVEDNAQCRLVETHLGADESAYFSNPVTELSVGQNGVLSYYKLQQESPRGFHLATLESHQGRSSSVTTNVITLSGGLVRNETAVSLQGEGGWAQLDGLYLVSGSQHVDNFTRIEHVSPHCSSRELYKGILSDRGTGVFRGRIVVAKGAQKTDSKQTNSNLLLSDHALINTKPQLEIYADDVKCTHGATIGQLDRDSVFYLRARGISEEAAKGILIYAFANEVVNRIAVDSLREKLENYLFDWLPMGTSVREAF